ncbi:hypothetical protein FEE95_12080 [Maribacter algarum]|uniref:LURP-one-related family protein n=1 Tax=Maribacter algarum (ex Zhang et al. 2020) TaxID=2578118 RepID=A0A5S3PR59_9FLAO|nr:hypothetical protein [Maribacter algarum]TMM57220.1 hypothetical protein FEE95_12080 [Maribacter algarum]
MQEFQFPLDFTFNIGTLSNDFTAVDAHQKTVAYVKQKLFKFKEDVSVFENENKTKVLYKIKADRWIDFSACYSFSDPEGKELGKIGRKGWASLWKAHYEIFDKNQQLKFTIREENAWVKVLDGLVGQIPILNLFTGLFLNPAYIVINSRNETVVRLSKEKSLVGRRFKVSEIKKLDGLDDDIIILGLMMMVLLERRKG